MSRGVLRSLGVTADDILAWLETTSRGANVKLTDEIRSAAQALEAGKIDYKEFLDTVGRSQPYDKVPPLTTNVELAGGLKSNQLEKGILGETKSLPEGTRVSSRLDIPAYANKGAWIETMHSPTGTTRPGAPIGYGKTAHLEDVDFTVGPDEALQIATGKMNKWPFAGMEGDYLATPAEKARRRAVQTRNRDDWIQVGMNPYRSGAFYERGTQAPLEGADEVIQIGPYVQARNPRFIPEDDPRLLTQGKGKGDKKVRAGVRFAGPTASAVGLGLLAEPEEAEASIAPGSTGRPSGDGIDLMSTPTAMLGAALSQAPWEDLEWLDLPQKGLYGLGALAATGSLEEAAEWAQKDPWDSAGEVGQIIKGESPSAARGLIGDLFTWGSRLGSPF